MCDIITYDENLHKYFYISNYPLSETCAFSSGMQFDSGFYTLIGLIWLNRDYI